MLTKGRLKYGYNDVILKHAFEAVFKKKISFLPISEKRLLRQDGNFKRVV